MNKHVNNKLECQFFTQWSLVCVFGQCSNYPKIHPNLYYICKDKKKSSIFMFIHSLVSRACIMGIVLGSDYLV